MALEEASAHGSFPIYSLFLPLYSFWSMDDFSWGNTRSASPSTGM
jgi:hypothetical protein